MHELSLSLNIVAIVAEHAQGRPVSRVRLAIGPRVCVERRSLLFCFDLAAAGTALEGAQLEFVDDAGDCFVIRDFEMQEAA